MLHLLLNEESGQGSCLFIHFPPSVYILSLENKPIKEPILTVQYLENIITSLMEKSKLKRNIESIIWTIVIVFLLRAFVVQGYVIPSGSMEDTLLPGDFVLAAKFVYGLEIPYTGVKFFQFYKPKRQKIVIFLFPVDKHRDFVKRCIGLPGDTIQIINKVVYVNGKPLDEPYAEHKDPRVFPPLVEVDTPFKQKMYQEAWMEGKFINEDRVRDNFGPVVVPENHIFVMGDNRDYSFDSRFWGPVPMKLLKGTPLIIYFSIDPEQPVWKLWKKIRFGRLFKIVLTA